MCTEVSIAPNSLQVSLGTTGKEQKERAGEMVQLLEAFVLVEDPSPT